MNNNITIRPAMKWEERMIKEAKKWASYSKDPSTKVGAVIYDPSRNSIVVTGFNGFPRGVSDSADLYLCKETKYKRVVHAEANCIADAAYQGKSTANMALAITHHPCADCAGIIIQAGIKWIIYEYTDDDMKRHHSEEAMRLFKEAGITVLSLQLLGEQEI